MEHLDRLDGKVAIVTGASRRIGRAIALALAARGADVVITARVSKEEIETVAEEVRALGRRATPVLCDLRREEDVTAVIEAARTRHGRLDVLVNNAAVRRSRSLLEMEPAEWRDTQAIILDGSFLMCRAAIPLMLQGGGGTILSIGGVPAHRGAARRAHVCAAKAGLVGLTKAIAIEFAESGITANVLVPGMIGGDAEGSSSDTRRSAEGVPLGRLGRVEEVAAMAVALCLPQARFMTGQSVHISGGLYMP